MPNWDYRWTRDISVERGPWKFFYQAIYVAKKEDKFWQLIDFKTCGKEKIESYHPDDFTYLIKKYGAQAARVAHEEAEKKMNFSPRREEQKKAEVEASEQLRLL